jgi:hypothetical protein
VLLSEREFEKATGIPGTGCARIERRPGELRASGRLGIWKSAILSCRTGNGAINVQNVRVRDISISGISFLCVGSEIGAHNQFLVGVGKGQQSPDSILWLITESIRQHIAGDGLLVVGAKFIQRAIKATAHVPEPVNLLSNLSPATDPGKSAPLPSPLAPSQ